MMPVFVSPRYLRLLADLLEEAGIRVAKIEDIHDWVNGFKLSLQLKADALGMSRDRAFPSWSRLLEEECYVVLAGLRVWPGGGNDEPLGASPTRRKDSGAAQPGDGAEGHQGHTSAEQRLGRLPGDRKKPKD